ncbi:MAG TPA: hypothetical protein VGN11_10320, partial [Candidatus Baltobacteraceae bacterium]|nr:hypothetical protein [Candidatus Baltobacteraceae bacterium]
KPGNYIHLALARHFNDRVDAGIDYYRFDPTYATSILPYGVPENIWSAAWSWPGPWLKSTYQLVDSTIVGINRAGYRAHADFARGRLEVRASLASYRQIEPITLANATQLGFVEGFFLPQATGYGTRGTQRQGALYLAWHLPKDDVAIDGVFDALHRDADAGHAQDYADMRYPQIVASVQHHFSKSAIGVAGYGRYSANGTWATTPVLGIDGVAFVGAQFTTGPATQLLVQIRRSALVGLPSIPGGPPPDMRATSLIVDQRVAF